MISLVVTVVLTPIKRAVLPLTALIDMADVSIKLPEPVSVEMVPFKIAVDKVPAVIEVLIERILLASI